MTLDPQNIADRLGATRVAEVPDVGGGAFGMARLAQLLKDRLDARGARRHGSAIAWALGSKVPVTAETQKQLIALAEKLSTPERRVSPIELAAQLLAKTVDKLSKDQAK